MLLVPQGVEKLRSRRHSDVPLGDRSHPAHDRGVYTDRLILRASSALPLHRAKTELTRLSERPRQKADRVSPSAARSFISPPHEDSLRHVSRFPPSVTCRRQSQRTT